jgi:hypothetical protein
MRMVEHEDIWFSQSEISFFDVITECETGILDEHHLCLRAARPRFFSY